MVWLLFYFPIYWEFHHPNWRSYFSEGWPNHQPAMLARALGQYSIKTNSAGLATCPWTNSIGADTADTFAGDGGWVRRVLRGNGALIITYYSIREWQIDGLQVAYQWIHGNFVEFQRILMDIMHIYRHIQYTHNIYIYIYTHVYIYATVKTCLTDMAGNPASFLAGQGPPSGNQP